MCHWSRRGAAVGANCARRRVGKYVHTNKLDADSGTLERAAAETAATLPEVAI